MRFKNLISVVDSHTEGQTTRVVLSGYPTVPGATMAERKQYVIMNLDHLRGVILNEPRGLISSMGVILTPPVSEEAHFGVIWIEQGEPSLARYLDMCGHGTIGIVTTLVETGLVEAREPYTEVALDMPAGLVRARAAVTDGKVQSVTLRNVPCFFYESRTVDVPGLGAVPVDIAFGGNNYGIVEARDLGIGTTPAEINASIGLVATVIRSINEQGHTRHPEMPEISGVLALLIDDAPSKPGATRKNIYVDGGGLVDRSPCGTGTSARMAARFAKGQQGLDEVFVTESVIGSLFSGRLVGETVVGPYRAVVPEITGRAFIIGMNQLVVDGSDPFGTGFVC